MAVKKYDNSTELGDKIKNLRFQVSEKFSQEQIAGLLGISRSSFINIESGKGSIKISVLEKICEIFEVPLGFLIEEENIFYDIESDDTYYNFKKILLYILNKVGDKPNFGKKVLYKLLYFSEFDYYEIYGKSLLGIEFKKLPMGPVPDPDVSERIFQNMIDHNQLSLISTRYKGYEQQRYISGIKDIDTVQLVEDNSIGGEGTRVIDEVIDKLSHMNGNEISHYSHGDMPYIATKNIGEVIDKELVFYRTPEYEVSAAKNDI